MDNMVNAYKSAVLENYANFEGRLSRGGFWWFVLANILISIGFSIIGQIIGFVFLSFIYSLAVLVPSIAAVVRRLHDVGKTGLLALLGLIPIIGAIILIVMCIPEGDTEANEYGPPPASIAT